MIKNLPGTTIEMDVPSATVAKDFLDNAFLCGGLMMNQVARLTGLEPYMIQNWVKRGFVSPPQKKLYTKRQFCRIVIINMLRDVLQIEKITALLSYINGRLDDESDDIIDDSDLYIYYIAAVSEIDAPVFDKATFFQRIERVTSDFNEPFPGARERLINVIGIMFNAHLASTFRKVADDIFNTLEWE